MPHAYSTSYFPPFPTVPVILRNSESGAYTPELLAYIDTGADGTLAPATYLDGWTTLESYSVRMRSHWGEARNALVYVVDLEVAGHLLPGVDVVADTRGHEVLLGRNVLNLLIVLLDGPHGLTDILSRRPARVR
jgi:predicted aspartyl protease